jgi:hypothetical protein
VAADKNSPKAGAKTQIEDRESTPQSEESHIIELVSAARWKSDGDRNSNQADTSDLQETQYRDKKMRCMIARKLKLPSKAAKHWLLQDKTKRNPIDVSEA